MFITSYWKGEELQASLADFWAFSCPVIAGPEVAFIPSQLKESGERTRDMIKPEVRLQRCGEKSA